MEYDPIKKTLGNFFNRSVFLRILFYRLLDLLLLRAWHIKRELKEWLRTREGESMILDAGSGFGQYSYRMASMSGKIRVKAIDIKEDQIWDCNQFVKRTNLSSRLSFHVEDLNVFCEPEQYDLILSVDVMEHIEEDRKVFTHFFQSLKPGGSLLISTPSDIGGSDAHEAGEASFIEEHVRNGYGKDEITGKLHESGFASVNVRYSYGWPGKLSWKLSMKIPVILLNASRLFLFLLPIYYLFTWPICLILNFMDVNMEHPSGTGLIVKAHKL
jgi:SAM-dependent methyltransferase